MSLLSSSPPLPPTTPSRTRSGAAPTAVGLLAAGIYWLILTAYLAYLPLFQWDWLVSLEQSYGDAPFGVGLLAFGAWLVGSTLLIAGFAGLGLRGLWAAGVAALNAVAGAAFSILWLFVMAAGPGPSGRPPFEPLMLFYILDAGLVVAISVPLAAIYQRWGVWAQSGAVAVAALSLVVAFAALTGVPVFAQPWLILGCGVVAFLVGWGWSQLTRQR
jgi:hypothetical protein